MQLYETQRPSFSKGNGQCRGPWQGELGGLDTQTELLMGVQCTVILEATHAYLIVTIPATQLAGIVMDLEAADGVTVPSICFRPGWDGWGQGAWVTDCDWSD